MSQTTFQSTRRFNWQPQEHYGPEGSDGHSEWTAEDFAAAEQFLTLSEQNLTWTKPTPEWIERTGVKGDPDWFAEASGGLLVVGQNIWLGFPDPPEFTIVQLDLHSRRSVHLGHFDHWPESWTTDA